MSHGWLNSLLQNLRDRIAPERLPPLQLTSNPVAAFGAESSLQILDWSNLISTPKVFHPDVAQRATSSMGVGEPAIASIPDAAPVDPVLLQTRFQLVRDIGRSRFRSKIWISLAVAEAVFFLVAIFKFQ